MATERSHTFSNWPHSQRDPSASPPFLSHNVLFFLVLTLMLCLSFFLSPFVFSKCHFSFCPFSICFLVPTKQSFFFFHSLTLFFSPKSLFLLLLSGLVSSQWGDSFINELRAEVINCGMSDRDAISSAGNALAAVVLQAGRRSHTGSDTAGVCHQPAITLHHSHLPPPADLDVSLKHGKQA